MNRLVVGLVVTVILALGFAGWEARSVAGWRGKAETWHAAADSAGRRADAKVTVFFHDTVAKRVKDHAADTLRDSLRTVHDSLLAARARRDTVRIAALESAEIKLVPVVISALDTARAACSLAVRDCGEALAERTLERDALRKEAAAWHRAANAGRLWGLPLPRVGIGYAAVLDLTTTRLAHGPAVALTWTISF